MASIDKSRKEREEREWRNDVESLESKKELLSRIRTPSLRTNIIARMQVLKDKYPIHLKDYEIPEV